jgi:hypothetical protein
MGCDYVAEYRHCRDQRAVFAPDITSERVIVEFEQIAHHLEIIMAFGCLLFNHVQISDESVGHSPTPHFLSSDYNEAETGNFQGLNFKD